MCPRCFRTSGRCSQLQRTRQSGAERTYSSAGLQLHKLADRCVPVSVLPQQLPCCAQPCAYEAASRPAAHQHLAHVTPDTSRTRMHSCSPRGGSGACWARSHTCQALLQAAQSAGLHGEGARSRLTPCPKTAPPPTGRHPSGLTNDEWDQRPCGRRWQTTNLVTTCQ